MQADETLVAYIASTYYELRPVLGSIKRLHGYDDRNFLLTDSADNKTYVLKIVNRRESARELTDIIDEILWNAYDYCESKATGASRPGKGHFVVPKPKRTTGNKLSTFTTVKYRLEKAGAGPEFEEVICNIKMSEYFEGQTMFDYIGSMQADSRSLLHTRPGSFYFRLGELGKQLFAFLRTQQHLLAELDAIRARDPHPWRLKTSEVTIRRNLERLYPAAGVSASAATSAPAEDPKQRRELVERVLDEFISDTKPKLARLPEFILHSDLCNQNIMIDLRRDRICLIDFQDLQVGQQVLELAIMILYSVIEQRAMPFERALAFIPRWIYLGYQSNSAWPIDPSEMALVPSLMKLRLVQSLLNGQVAFEREPQNSYVMYTNQRGWQLLHLMSDATCVFGRPDELASSWLAAGEPSAPSK